MSGLVERWRTWDGGDAELLGGEHDGHRVWMPPGPLRPWVEVVVVDHGRLVAVRTWTATTRTTSGALYRLTEETTAAGLPVYVPERRANPRRP